MATIIHNNVAPIWVWIIVIGIGSLLVLGTIAYIVRIVLRRRREQPDAEMISNEPPEKKLTLRRGRLVPATSYLSLTGSRFGTSSYGEESRTHSAMMTTRVMSPCAERITSYGTESQICSSDRTSSTQSVGSQTRMLSPSPSFRVQSYGTEPHIQSIRSGSRSPFDWFASLKHRSSATSYNSRFSMVQQPNSPKLNSFYRHGDQSTSKLSVTSQAEKLRADVVEIKVAKPQATYITSSPPSSRISHSYDQPNFSRTVPAQNKTARNHTLSRIEEATPRHSMFSTKSFRTRVSSYAPSENAATAPPIPSKRDSSSSFLGLPLSLSIFNSTTNQIRNSFRFSFQEEKKDEYPEDKLERFQTDVQDEPYYTHHVIDCNEKHDPPFTTEPITKTEPSSMSSTPLTQTFPLPPTYQPLVENPKSFSIPRRSLGDQSMSPIKQFDWPEENTIQHGLSLNDAAASSTQLTNPSEIKALPPLPQLSLYPYPRKQDEQPQSARPIGAVQLPSEPTPIPIPVRTPSKKGNVLRKKSLQRSRTAA